MLVRVTRVTFQHITIYETHWNVLYRSRFAQMMTTSYHMLHSSMRELHLTLSGVIYDDCVQFCFFFSPQFSLLLILHHAVVRSLLLWSINDNLTRRTAAASASGEKNEGEAAKKSDKKMHLKGSQHNSVARKHEFSALINYLVVAWVKTRGILSRLLCPNGTMNCVRTVDERINCVIHYFCPELLLHCVSERKEAQRDRRNAREKEIKFEENTTTINAVLCELDALATFEERK